MKKLLEKINFSPYWHLEIIIAIPVIIVWTILFVIIALK